MIIIPIACTAINWEEFVSKCTNCIQRSPTRSLDKNSLPVGSIDSFLSTLEEFHLKDSNPREISEFTLDHVYISFFMLLDTWVYYSILERISKNIHIIKCKDYDNKIRVAVIATGSLKDWKESIINYTEYPEWTMIMWDILLRMGFGRIFKDYKISSLNQIEKRS